MQKPCDITRIIKQGYLLLLILVGFVIGMGVAFLYGKWQIFIPLLISLFISIISFKRGKIALFTFLLFMGIGTLFGSIRINPSQKEGTYVGVVIEAKANYFLFFNNGVRYYVYEKENVREEGDFLEVRGKAEELNLASYESRFSFEEYLNKKGVFYSLDVQEIKETFKRPIRLREYEKNFLSSFNSLASGTLDSLLFGYKDYKNATIKEASTIGAITILGTSGLLYGGLCRIFERFIALRLDGRKKEIAVLIFASLLFPFGILKVGYWRVYLGKVLNLVFCLSKAPMPQPVSRTSLTAIFLLLFNFRLALNQGFLIGYGLSIFMGFWRPYSLRYPKRKRALLSFLFLSSFLFPIYVSSGEFHLLSPFYSLLLLPLIYPFVMLGYLSFITIPFRTLLNGYSKFIFLLVSLMSKADLVLPVGEYGLLIISIYYFSLFIFSYLLQLGLTFFARRAIALLSLIILTYALPLPNLVTRQVTFINVGQGDAILIRDHFTSVLIDTGGSNSFDMAKEVLIPFFRKEKIYKLDALIITHGDFDHNGAKESLISNFSVNNVLDSKSQFPCRIGNLTFINHNDYQASQEDENVRSLVLSLNFMNKKWLFMGDAPIEVEKNIIKKYPELDCDVIKVGHHGSNTSSSLAFLKHVSPETAIISCAKNNYYGHPHQRVIDNLKTLGINIRRTDLEGSISFSEFG